MSNHEGMLRHVAGVAVFFVVLTVVVFAVGESIREPHANALTKDPVIAKPIAAEAGMYAGYPKAMTEAPRVRAAKQRDLHTYYERRAYNGAPPMVPHETGEEHLMADDCLSCHEDGGYVPKWQAYAPVTPHPTYLNCRQCHLPINEDVALFKSTTWRRPAPPDRNVRAMPGAPLVMPHGTQLRESCNACHAGPGAVKQIRVSHPWRTNCRQCHVPPRTSEEFTRPGPIAGGANAE